MPEGQPSISQVNFLAFIDGDETQNGYHITLDENKKWDVQFTAERAAGNQNELSLSCYKPGDIIDGPGRVRFLNFNDSYPSDSYGRSSYPDYKFDNEDIYVACQYKSTFNGPGGWLNCAPLVGEIVGNNGFRCVFGVFDSALTRVATVTIKAVSL